jgi:hypothetical protein
VVEQTRSASESKMLTPVYENYEPAAADYVRTGKQRGCRQTCSDRQNKRPRGRPSVMPLFREELNRLAFEGALAPTMARHGSLSASW